MANEGDDVGMDMDPGPAQQPARNQADLREISIILDGWSRTCDSVLQTLNDQITIINNNNK